MAYAWQVEPTSARIVDVVIAADRCVVKDEFLRTGRCSRRTYDEG